MEDGEVEFSDRHIGVAKPTSSGSGQESASVECHLVDFLKNSTTCSHTHTCNPPTPGSLRHTYTCYHTHTQFIRSGEIQKDTNSSHNKKPKRPLGNREAVRRYREKKKAHAAYLEEEVKKLRLLNQQLVMKLQRLVVLEAEALSLRTLLVDVRGRIDNELDSFPNPKRCSNYKASNNICFKEGDSVVQSGSGVCGLSCETEAPCFDPVVMGQSLPVGCVVGGEMPPELPGKENCQPAAGTECHVSELDRGVS